MSSEEFEYFFDLEELDPQLASQSMDAAVDKPADSSARETETTVGTEPKPESESEPCGTDDPTSRDIPPTPPSSAPPDVASPVETADEPIAPPSLARESTEPAGGGRRTRAGRPLSVHALGQVVYCMRSAILAVELSDETDVEDPPPRLDYLPNFDLERIEQRLSRSIRRFWLGLVLLAALCVLMVVGVAESSRLLFYPAFTASIICLLWLADLLSVIFQLSLRRRAAMRAQLQEPDPRIQGVTPVNWWSMLKAGFEPVKCQSPFRHPDLPLEGSPWRVLERGSLRIPVVRSGSDKLGPRKNDAFPKHHVRLAAYAMLLEATGHVEVPYGLVFPADSVKGLAIPITAALRELAARKLEQFAKLLDDSQSGRSEPRPPQDRGRCTSCRHGQPQPITDRQIKHARQAGAGLLLLAHRSGRRYHSVCGDRFGSAPPHGASIKLGLTPLLE